MPSEDAVTCKKAPLLFAEVYTTLYKLSRVSFFSSAFVWLVCEVIIGVGSNAGQVASLLNIK